jgi:hypothetical protein
MREEIQLFILFISAAFSCKSGKTETTNKNKLVGTWKLIEYSDFDTLAKKWIHLTVTTQKAILLIPRAG